MYEWFERKSNRYVFLASITFIYVVLVIFYIRKLMEDSLICNGEKVANLEGVVGFPHLVCKIDTGLVGEIMAFYIPFVVVVSIVLLLSAVIRSMRGLPASVYYLMAILTFLVSLLAWFIALALTPGIA